MNKIDIIIKNNLKKLELEIDNVIEKEFSNLDKDIRSIFDYDVQNIRKRLEDCIMNEETREEILVPLIKDTFYFVDLINNNKRELINLVITEYISDKASSINALAIDKAINVISMYGAINDASYIIKKHRMFELKITNKLKVYINLICEDVLNEIQNEYNYYIKQLREYINKLNTETEIKTEITDEVKNIRKIFKPKDMDKLLKSRGLEPVRQKGSHKIYTNGEKTTIVPQHTLGKGLSYKIQKQIG